jgi:gliding motility-associated-like protein
MTAIVTNEHGCVKQDSLFVRVIELKTDALIHPISCYGKTDGSISLATIGGTLPYRYQWKHTSVDTSYLDNLSENTYSVTITDSNVCFIDTSFVIIEPDSLTISLHDTISLTYCDEFCRGQIRVECTGGTLPYSFTWITGDTTAFISSLCVGDYVLWYSDKHGCGDTLLFQVYDTSDMKATYTSEPTSCSGTCDGTVQLATEEGLPPFVYRWKTNDSTAFVDSLCKGIYDVSIIDFQHCIRRLFPRVGSPDPIQIEETTIVHPYCSKRKNGSITVQSTGGTLPHTYWWNGIEGTNVLANLDSAGAYTLSITDANGCRLDTVFYLPELDTLSISHTSQNIPCRTVCGGSIHVSVSGGISPYSYRWFDGSTDNYVDSLCVGTYQVWAYDSNACEVTKTVEINIDSTYFPQNIDVWADDTTVFRGFSTTLYGSDHGSGFNYTWSPADYLNTTKGTRVKTTPLDSILYIYTVSDAYGCLGSDSILIFVSDIICREPYLFVPNAFSPNGDGLNDVLYVRGRILDKVEFAVFDRWGEKLFETKDKDKGWDGVFRGKKCEPGIYVYYLDAICIGGERYIHKGNVTLIR